MDQDLTFQQIKERIELPDLLTHYGYALQKDADQGQGKYHVFEGQDKDTLVVFKGQGGDWRYFNSQDDRDKGTAIDWMKNRVSTGQTAGIEQLPGRDLWQSVSDNFRAYLNLPEAERPQLKLPPLTETAPGEKFPSTYTAGCRPLDNTAYLESQGLTKATLDNPQFAGRILTQLHPVQREGLPTQTVVATAFPTYHEGRVVGLEVQGEGVKNQATESQFARALWLSKLPEGPPPTHLVVSESAITTLSYAQLHPGESALYAATAGALTPNKVFEMKRLLAAENIPAIKSAFGNDTQGHQFDTRLLAGFANEQNPLKVVREHPHLLTVEVTTANLGSVQAVSEQLKAFNAQTKQQYERASGEVNAPTVAQTLRDELISSAQLGPATYQFHIPLNREALGAFNQAISQNLQYDQKIELVKSQGQDWNHDVKQDQAQRAVKSELDSVGKSQQNPDNYQQNDPITGATSTTQQQEAREKGERLVIVEFRESRDTMSQLSNVEQNLEKAGLKINHSLRLETDVPREIATAITLRYPLDSAQLPAISQALDTLATNPRATLIEPAPDAAERRQLAAAQEQAKEQQRQAGPQIQPSESPAHDQARLAFIQAAGPVAKVLRESGAGLEAAYLQQLSKTVVRQPELKGVDQEQLTKVLAKVDKLPALKDNADAAQLRQAAQVLDKPVQGYGQPQKPEPPTPEVRKRGPKL